MSFLVGPLTLLALASLITISRRRPDLWLVGVLSRTAVVFLMAEVAWFGGLMTGVIGLDWLVRWLGTPKLQPPWDKIAFFGPAAVVGVAYFIFEMSRSREAFR
jgi:hypothetical protein